jgi:phosphatidylethanolamine/phosphatidyl-N-methylethanolamine N-methyltransferase
MEFRSPKSRPDTMRRRADPLLGDETAFLRKLIENPRLTGAIAPSGPHLARAMAKAAAGASREGLVIELGPGTGPVTKALIEQGVTRERLVLVEYDPSFCRLLAQRFAPARVVQGDAYDLQVTLAEFAGRRVAAVVSSLPLLNQPPHLREKLIEDAFALMGPRGLFVQFTYGLKSPIPKLACVNRYAGQCSGPIWRNLPPARVWSYRADPLGFVAEPVLGRLRAGAGRLGRAWRDNWQEKKTEAEVMLRRQRARMRAALDREVRTVLAGAHHKRRVRAERDAPPEA